MATMTFQVNDAGGDAPAVWVTISENPDGTLRFDTTAELFIKTQERQVASYLVKPLSDQVMRAFREDET